MYTPEGMFAFLGSVIIILTVISAATLALSLAQYFTYNRRRRRDLVRQWRKHNGKR